MDQPKSFTQLENLRASASFGSLPAAWMERLQSKMTAIYGHRFTSLFPDGDSMSEWRDTWGRALAGLSGEQIAQGLAKLATGTDGWPPTSGEFRALCVPPKPIPAHQRHPLLDAPKPVKTNRAATVREAAALLDGKKASKQWARDLKARDEAGEKLTYTQSRFWREALQADLLGEDGE